MQVYNVAYIMNSINRYGIANETTEENVDNAAYPVDVFISDNGSSDKRIIRWAEKYATKFTNHGENIGNAASLNRMILAANEHDFIVMAGNDIKLPKGWLKEAISAFDKCPTLGILGFNCCYDISHNIEKDGVKFSMANTGVVLGTVVVRSDVFKKVGYLNEWSNYGHWDATFCRRAKLHFDAFYLRGFDSSHVGGKDNPPEYAAMKNREVTKGWVGANKWHKQYYRKDVYLDINQEVHEN